MTYNIEDYKGKKIGHLTPISVCEEKAKDGGFQWYFQCDCGKIIKERPYRVIRESRLSCGCMRNENCQRVNPDDYIGRKNNRLTVIGYERLKNSRRLSLKCLCDCGNETFVYPYQFDTGDIKSCGCLKIDFGKSKRKHGLSKSSIYSEYNNMIRRCYNKESDNYERYGGRGITVCDEWKDSIKNFEKWVESTGGRPEGTTLDRIDNDGPYAPWNCRWATMKEQSRNKRSNIMITYKGRTQCLADWSKELGFSHETLRGRIFKHGWSIEKAFETPVGASNKGRFKKGHK